jgi:hypothetical protein
MTGKQTFKEQVQRDMVALDYHYGEKNDADSVHRAAWTKVLTIREILISG